MRDVAIEFDLENHNRTTVDSNQNKSAHLGKSHWFFFTSNVFKNQRGFFSNLAAPKGACKVKKNSFLNVIVRHLKLHYFSIFRASCGGRRTPNVINQNDTNMVSFIKIRTI